MSEIDVNEFYRRAITEAIEREGTNPFALSKEAGISGSGLRDILSGEVTSTTIEKLAKIARALNTPLAKLLPPDGRAATSEQASEVDVATIRLPIVGSVQAGIWVEELPHDPDAPQETIPVVPDRDYAGYRQYALRVRGDSVDEIIPDGDFAICADVATLREWQKGDLVVVERVRGDGAMRETTIKEIEIDENGKVFLKPRSKNKHWNKLIELNDDGATEIHLRGLVIGRYSPLRRRM